MKRTVLCLALVSTGVLFASDNELNLTVGKQFTRSYSASTDIMGYTVNGKVEPDKPVAIGLRYGRDVIGLGPAQLQLQLAYHAETSSDVTWSADGIGSVTDPEKYKNSGFSAGLQAQWRMGVTLGLGAELRYEKIKWSTEDASQTRPWINARLGFQVPMPIVQPVFGLEVAVPVTNQSGTPNSSSDLLKRLSPNFEMSLYGGIRF